VVIVNIVHLFFNFGGQVEQLTPTRGYMARAVYDWIEDNKLTPYIVVDATYDGVIVPEEYVREGRIILNVASTAVRSLSIEAETLSFSARFGGVAMDLWLPIGALQAVYARENGKGLFFERDGDIQPPPSGSEYVRKTKKPSLKVVK